MPDLAAYTALGFGLGDSPAEREIAARLGLTASALAHKVSTRYQGAKSTSGILEAKTRKKKTPEEETKQRIERGKNHAVLRQLLHEMRDGKHGFIAQELGDKWATIVDACPGFTYIHGPCRELVFKGNSCHFALCEYCGFRRSRSFLEVLEKVGASYILEPKLGSFTLGNNVPVLTWEILGDMSAAFTALMRRKYVRQRVRGAIRSIEVTWNFFSGTWHPHIHVLFDSDWMDKEILAKLWTEECQRFKSLRFETLRPWWYEKFDIPEKQKNYFVDMRQADADAIHEVAKYITKPIDVIRAGADKVVEFLIAIKCRRLYEKYGTLRNIKIDWELGEVDGDKPEVETPMKGWCPWENCPDRASPDWEFYCKGHFESTMGVEYVFCEETHNSRIVKGWRLRGPPE
jgi:hypothetical protein